MSKDLLDDAIKEAGSQEALGKAIGFSQNAIHHAKKVGRVSPIMARRLDEWSDGKFPKHELRPDIFDAPNSGATDNQAAA